jgi:hypothetical protein
MTGPMRYGIRQRGNEPQSECRSASHAVRQGGPARMAGSRSDRMNAPSGFKESKAGCILDQVRGAFQGTARL